MTQRRIVRSINRPATHEEKARHERIREQIEAEKPRLNRIGREAKAAQQRRQAQLRGTLALLKSTREATGLSLADVAVRTGIDKANLSRLENAEDANPTLDTLQRYAQALNKELVITLTEKSEQQNE